MAKKPASSDSGTSIPTQGASPATSQSSSSASALSGPSAPTKKKRARKPRKRRPKSSADAEGGRRKKTKKRRPEDAAAGKPKPRTTPAKKKPEISPGNGRSTAVAKKTSKSKQAANSTGASTATTSKAEAKPRPVTRPTPKTQRDEQKVAQRRASQQEKNRKAGPRDDADEEETGTPGLFRQMSGFLVSIVVHVQVLLVLALITIQVDPDVLQTLTFTPVEETPEEETVQEMVEPEILEIEPQELTETFEVMEVASSSELESEAFDLSAIDDNQAAEATMELQDIGTLTNIRDDLMAKVGTATGSGVSGRGNPASRKQLLARYGGNEASEKAVALGLKWLAEHQNTDGSWSFDHRTGGACRGRCDHPGTIPAQSRSGATGLALLPFLGAGNTHKQGQYKKEVWEALYYLISVGRNRNYSFHEPGGSMYSHGICAIALAEAYAMTQDKELRVPAQQAINFIVAAQDPVGGGWRYQPRTPGDTSVVGWQVMALKSGQMGYLAVPPATFNGATHFLNSVQSNGGAEYGYTSPGRGQARTAVGLLCRMYLGWKRENEALDRGADLISKWGPSTKGDMYYNYYATQVMHHIEGERWEKWNEVMRDFLIESQETKSHKEGSWFFGGDHGAERGGRLYTTAMSVMTLEVYYRHLPLYSKQSVEDDFFNE